MLRVAAITSGVAAACLLSAGIAQADDNDTEGGHCEYGDASVNIMPSCDTSGAGTRGELEQILRPLEPTLPSTSDDAGDMFGGLG